MYLPPTSGTGLPDEPVERSVFTGAKKKKKKEASVNADVFSGSVWALTAMNLSAVQEIVQVRLCVCVSIEEQWTRAYAVNCERSLSWIHY